MTLRKWRFPNIPVIRNVGYPSPIPSFRAQREIFLALRAFLLPSQMDSRFLLSHIRHYPFLPERSLDFARDDDTGIALSKHIRCTLRKINPFSPPYRHFECSREILLALCSFLLLSQKFPPFPLSHIGRYTSVQERSLGSAFDDIAGKTLTQHVLSLSPRNTIPFLLVYLFPHTYNKMRETLIQSRNLISHVFSTI